jgi:hypothetical protein
MKLSKLGIFASLLLCFFFAQSCTTRDGIKENNNSRNVKEPLPNGMVDLSFSIIKVIERNGIEYCSAKIIKVFGYGNSVRALAEESIYEFEIDDKLIKEYDFKSNIGNTIRCKLINLPGAMKQNFTNKLKIVSINNS